MELDLVDSIAEAVVRPQPRRVLIGLESPADDLPAGRPASKLGHLRLGPPRALTPQPFREGEIQSERVVVAKRRRLVLHFMRRHAPSLSRRYGNQARALRRSWFPAGLSPRSE